MSHYRKNTRMGPSLVILVILATFCYVDVDFAEASCWSDWSRCSKWSSAGTGPVWDDCPTRCKSKGFSSGNCREVPSTCWFISGKVGQCKCY